MMISSPKISVIGLGYVGLLNVGFVASSDEIELVDLIFIAVGTRARTTDLKGFKTVIATGGIG